MRQSARGEGFESLVIEWDAPRSDRPSGFEVRDVSIEALGDARAAAHALRSSDATVSDVARVLARVVGGLATSGIVLPLDEHAFRAQPPPDMTIQLSRALDELVSDMAHRPMMIDLHERLGVSLRTANRLVQEFNAKYGFNASTWQDTRSRRRVLISAALLTARRVTASGVAAAMGYASLPSLSRALRQAGMPPPSEIPTFVRELADRDPACPRASA